MLKTPLCCLVFLLLFPISKRMLDNLSTQFVLEQPYRPLTLGMDSMFVINPSRGHLPVTEGNETTCTLRLPETHHPDRRAQKYKYPEAFAILKMIGHLLETSQAEELQYRPLTAFQKKQKKKLVIKLKRVDIATTDKPIESVKPRSTTEQEIEMTPAIDVPAGPTTPTPTSPTIQKTIFSNDITYVNTSNENDTESSAPKEPNMVSNDMHPALDHLMQSATG